MKRIAVFLFSLLVLLFLDGIYAQIPTNGLVAYYPFNGGPNDESGNGNHGMVYGADLTTDRCGIDSSAYSFDGFSNYIELPPTIARNTDNSFSIIAWVNNKYITSDGKYTDNAIYGQSDGYADNDYPVVLFEISTNNNLRGAIRGVTAPALNLYSPNPIPNNQWYQVAMVRDASDERLSLFINGILVITGKNQLIGNTASNDFVSLGAWFDDLQTMYHFFCGKIDDVLIYNRALTQNEILGLYNFNCNISEIDGDNEVCQGQQNVTYSIDPIDDINYVWNYSGTGVSISGSSNHVTLDFANNSTSGNLSVTISGAHITTQTSFLPIRVNPLPGNAGIIQGLSTICGDQGANYAIPPISNATSYNWVYDGIGANFIGNSNNVLIYFAENVTEGNLSVEGSNNCGHGAISPAFPVTINCIVDITFDIKIPNSFSPNGDGTNEYFVIDDLPENAKLLIFNREGKELYASENYQNDWNGTDQNGHKLETGTYWYILKIEGITNDLKGFVYLKK